MNLAEVFEEYDTNKNTTLEMSEFTKLIKDMNPKSKQKAIETLFLLMDLNED